MRLNFSCLKVPTKSHFSTYKKQKAISKIRFLTFFLPFLSWSACRGALQHRTAFCCLCSALGEPQIFFCLKCIERIYLCILFFLSDQNKHLMSSNLIVIIIIIDLSNSVDTHDVSTVLLTFGCRWRHPLGFIVFLFYLTDIRQRLCWFDSSLSTLQIRKCWISQKIALEFIKIADILK